MKRKTAKEILAESFLELAATVKIDRITVKDIVNNCGYSSATFYRQYKDKYDLIAWAYTRDLELILDRLEYNRPSWKQILHDAVTYFDENRDYLSNLLMHTSGYDSFIHNMTEIHCRSLEKRILYSSGLAQLPEKIKTYILLYCSGAVHVSCDWILGKSRLTTQELSDIFDESLPSPLRRFLSEE